MGKIWAFLIVVSSMYAIFTGRHEQLLDGILSIPQESFDFLIVILSSTVFGQGLCIFLKKSELSIL